MPTRRYVVKSSVEETYQMIRLSQSMDSVVFKELRDFGDDKKNGHDRLRTILHSNE